MSIEIPIGCKYPRLKKLSGVGLVILLFCLLKSSNKKFDLKEKFYSEVTLLF